jgi:hypothetical protein
VVLSIQSCHIATLGPARSAVDPCTASLGVVARAGARRPTPSGAGTRSAGASTRNGGETMPMPIPSAAVPVARMSLRSVRPTDAMRRLLIATTQTVIRATTIRPTSSGCAGGITWSETAGSLLSSRRRAQLLAPSRRSRAPTAGAHRNRFARGAVTPAMSTYAVTGSSARMWTTAGASAPRSELLALELAA